MAALENSSSPEEAESWPDLPLEAWRDTCETLHMWTQIVGKIRLALAPFVNHWWQVPLYLSARGLTTSPIPYGRRAFQIDFDFIDHQLVMATDTGSSRQVALAPRSVADFYREVMTSLKVLGIEVSIWTRPVEIAAPVPFEKDTQHGSYDPEYAHRFWRVLAQAARVLADFRSGFVGKCSPVHFFWGSFDLALTRFSGRRAPLHPGGVPNIALWAVQEAYSHECSSCGFWPGSSGVAGPMFYSYVYPEPAGFRDYPVQPAGAAYDPNLREFVLPYAELRRAVDADAALRQFLQSTYAAAADLGGWNRGELERRQPFPGQRTGSVRDT